MNDLNRDIIKTRLRFLDLIKSFLFEPPDAERLSRWRGTFFALSGTLGTTRLDAAIQTLAQRLENDRLTELQADYEHLFSPGSGFQALTLNADKEVAEEVFPNPDESLRTFFAEAGLEPADASALTLLDAQISLIKSEKAGYPTAPWQARLVSAFLVPFFERFVLSLHSRRRASFYYDCCVFSLAYLEVEQALFSHQELNADVS